MSLPSRNARALLAKMDAEELAMQFVIMTTGTKRHGKIYTSQDVLFELQKKVEDPILDPDIYIQRARETLAMCGDDQALIKN